MPEWNSLSDGPCGDIGREYHGMVRIPGTTVRNNDGMVRVSEQRRKRPFLSDRIPWLVSPRYAVTHIVLPTGTCHAGGSLPYPDMRTPP
jgi:hypothetical protein